MNWLQKTSQQPGELAILSVHGAKDFAVVRVQDHGQAVQENIEDYYPGESIPYMVFHFFSEGGSPSESYYAPGRSGAAHPSNYYNTLSDLIRKSISLPDQMMDFFQKDHIRDFMSKYPELRGDIETASDVADYQEFEISGYAVQVFNDTRAVQNNPAIMQTRGTEGIYYWYIPELQTRSTDRKEGIDQSPWGSGRYPTMQRAIETSEQYINHLFYGDS